ncbi:MAG TPA: outer membrane lipoprotein-sorting protein [bacterium]|nr:outer membrane lipoprotein-sorting protein [bacterium]
MKTYALIILSALLAVTLLPARAADLTADEIVAKANDASYYAGKDGSATAKMTLSDGRTREFVILRKNSETNKEQKFYVYFNGPADVRKMAYLVWKKPGGDDDRWLFLPALNLVKRIAPGDKRTSFVGSDFYYEDVSGRSLDADMHELVETTDTQYVVKNTPREPGTVEFAHYTVWIDKDTFIPRKAEYVDRNGTMYRRLTAEDIQTIQGYPTSMKQYAEDLSAGTRTEIEFSDVKFDIGLKDQIFTERFLRRPPREATR